MKTSDSNTAYVSQSASNGENMRPTVARQISDRGVWIFGAIAVVGGLALFASLENRRSVSDEKSLFSPRDDNGQTMLRSPPELFIPPDPYGTFNADPGVPSYGIYPNYAENSAPVFYASRINPITSRGPASFGVALRNPLSSQEVPPPVGPYSLRGQRPPAPSFNEPNEQSFADRNRADAKSAIPEDTDERVNARPFPNPTTTIPKGTIVQAVLESALDSTRAGLVRAIISRDVYGFDGSRVLIPKGSRLIGDYKSDVAEGQKRVLVEWQRLMRPDGVIVNIKSPSADALGRAGIQGKTKSRFAKHFGEALFQSALTVGSAVAASKLAGSNAAVYALPGLFGLQGALSPGGRSGAGAQQDTAVQLIVNPGASVSVFVAVDLDFSAVESR